MKAWVYASAVLAGMLPGSGVSFGQQKATAHDWVGVWNITDPAKAGGRVTLADDGGSLAGTITFNVKNHDTGERIGIEVRSLVNPHMEGDALVFEVRHILRPHLQGETEADVAKDTELAQMTMKHVGEGKATMSCANCGNPAPLAMAKEE